MRNIVALAFVAAASLGACAWGDGSGSDDGGSDDDGDDANRPDATIAVCGDSVCAASEFNSCVADCGTPEACGNDTCAGGETTASCPADCAPQATCGDDTCDAAGGETEATCPGDCGGTPGVCPSDAECLACVVVGACAPGVTEELCIECTLGGGGGAMCPNGMCDVGEDTTTCPFDCM